jgi:hypothetical protein
MLVPVRIPYQQARRRAANARITAAPRQRHRRAPRETAWLDEMVLIKNATTEEAPVAYSIRPREGIYAVRRHADRLWWPLFSGRSRFTMARYLAEAARGAGPWLSMMSSAPTLVRRADGSYHQPAADESLDSRRRLATQIAGQTMFCDDHVYVAAGHPACFVLAQGRNTQEVRVEVGCAHHGLHDAIDAYLPGPGSAARREAACRSLVFSPSEIREEIRRFELGRPRVAGQSSVTLCLDTAPGPRSAELCADAVVRRIASRIGPNQDRTARMIIPRELNVLPATDLLPVDICDATIRRALDLYPGDSIRQRFGLHWRAVHRTCDRLFKAHATRELEDALARLARPEL